MLQLRPHLLSNDVLESRHVRALLRLIGEVRELAAEPSAWRRHLAAELDHIWGAAIVVVSEVRVTSAAEPWRGGAGPSSALLHAEDCGLEPARRAAFHGDACRVDPRGSDDVLGALHPLQGSAFTVVRDDLVDERTWDRSEQAERQYRRHGCDDLLVSVVPVKALGVACCVHMFRGPGAARLGAHERLFVDLLHESLRVDWGRIGGAERGARLTPRQRQVLARLREGIGEKQIAEELGVSVHTAHDHVKAIYRAFGAGSRGALLSRLAAHAATPWPRLAAERGAIGVEAAAPAEGREASVG